jgi:signal transduction histidine kinase
VKPLTQLPDAAPLELLPPCAATLAVLAEAGSEGFSLRQRCCLHTDPGTLLAALSLSEPLAARHLLRHLLTYSSHCANWHTEIARPTYGVSQQVGQVAEYLAQTAQVNAADLLVAGLLAPLGSLVRAQQGKPFRSAADDCLLTRRLVRRWKLPPWLMNLLLRLDMPLPTDATVLPENRRLLVVQAALALVQEHQGQVWVVVPASSGELLATLGLPGEIASQVLSFLHSPPEPPVALAPEATTLLLRSLKAAVLPERHTNNALVDELETELEELRSRLAQNHLQDQQQLQEEKLAALAEFAAGASHEINNPLAVISAQAQHLLKSEESLERAKGLERIITQAKRIHTLLRDLLLYARPPEPAYKPVNVRALVQAAMAKVADLALAREVRLETEHISSRLKATLDADLIEMALVCLLQNAIAAAPGQGWVRVRVVTENSSSVTFLVEDNGPGIPPEVRAHLFDPFYSGRKAGRGPGLGLSKVWRIAQLHGGSIDYVAPPPQPTQFRLRLPQNLAVAHPRLAARHTSRS